MAIRIQRLICNVTVHAPPSSSAATGPVLERRELPARTSASLVPALQRAPEAGESAVHEGPSETSGDTSRAGTVDTRKLADQVYRLMLDDLKIARERE